MQGVISEIYESQKNLWISKKIYEIHENMNYGIRKKICKICKNYKICKIWYP